MSIRRAVAVVVSTALAFVGLTVTLSTPAQALQGTVPGVTASSWQTNGVVRAIAAAGGKVFIGGEFTSMRPPGAASGTGEVARSRFAVLDASSGALITNTAAFTHTFNGTVRALAASADGSIMYVGGDFTNVDGSTRNRLAAINVSTGALLSWAPSANSGVYGLAASTTRVYAGGNFTTLAGVATTRLGAVTTSGAGVPSFVANADKLVYGVALSTDASKLYAAGAFVTFNGDATYHGAAAVDAGTGSTLPFPAGPAAIPPYTDSCLTAMKAVTVSGSQVYFASEGTGGGCFDGTFAASTDDGSLAWVERCLGATQGIAVIAGYLYTGSHAHDCSANAGYDPDAYPEAGWSRGLARHFLAFRVTDGTVGPWYPNTNGGPNNSGLGPRVLATDGTQLFVGGEFTTVNGVAQQGFTRFAPSGTSSAVPARPVTPRVGTLPGGSISITAQPPLDLDDTDLTVRLYRDGGTTPIATQDVHVLFWRNPIVTFVDSGVAVNTAHTYQVDAVETNGGTGAQASQRSPNSASVTARATVGDYQSAVVADSPTFFWQLGEPSGPQALDSSPGQQGGTYWRGITYGTAGPISGGPTAVTTGGVDGVISSNAMSSPSTYSAEAWFKTSTTSGGKIIGFGNRQNGYDFNGNPGLSSSYDKHVYMTNDGKLIFGVWNGRADTITTPGAYNDNQWHHVVATQGANGMALYVDGAVVGKNGVTTNQAYDGFWRVGGDNLGGWPSQPSSLFFNGTIADVAVYPAALTQTRVRAHYAAAGRTPPVIPIPSDEYGQSVYDDEPALYWRMDETSGTALADASNNSAVGTVRNAVTLGAAGALGTGSAAQFQGGFASSDAASAGPSAYSVEAWFATTSTSGGKIVGFGNSRDGTSSNYDKHLYLTNDGRVLFGVYNGGFDLLSSAANLNDGGWHHVVGTQGPDGMRLYVDDVLVGSNGVTGNQGYQGYWRVGGDNLGAWPDRPSSDYFQGRIDEVAVYTRALNATEVDDHYRASGRSGPDTVHPTVALTAPTAGATVYGPTTITAGATDNIGVVAVDFVVDGAVIDTDTTAPYTATWNATTAGPHTLTAVARDAAGNSTTSASVNVTVTVPDTTDPDVAITSPSDGASFVAGATQITADASDDVAVGSVEFFVDGASVGTDTTAPYEAAWNATAGSHTLTATATDTSGNATTSTEVHVTVTTPPDTQAPTVAITSPSAGSIPAGSTELAASASDNVGVTSVDFLVDGAVVDTDTTAPYAATWNATPGTHQVTAVARDAAGNSTTSASVNVTVTVPDTTDPDVAITSPSDGASFVAGATQITADASDDVAVGSVEFFVDGASVGTDTTAPYEAAWNATAGSHTLTATATDTSGNSRTSDEVHVTVTTPPDTTPPTVPTGLGSSNVTQTGATLAWNPSTDNSGTVASYRVVRNGTVLPAVVAGTSYTDSGLSPATAYQYAVRAVDPSGNESADSDAVTVTTQPVGPAVLYSDSFTGANGANWASSWTRTVVNGAADIQGNAGRLQFSDAANSSARAQLTGVPAAADTDLTFTYAWSSSAARAYFHVWTRGSGGWLNSYRPRNGYGLSLSSDGRTLSVLKVVGGTQTVLRNVSQAQLLVTTPQHVRLRVVGSTIQTKVWSDGLPEPVAWASTDTDTSVAAAGQTFLALNWASVNAGVKSVSIDDLTLSAG